MIVHDVDQNSPEWFACRCGKFTASEAQATGNQGKGLETLVFKKVAERLTGKQESNGYSNGDMDRGHELEAMAAGAYEFETGRMTKKIGFCELDQYTGASPDRTVGEDGLVEIKCKNDPKFVQEMINPEVEMEHYWQMQQQIWVTDRKWCDYVVFNPNFPKNIVIKRVNRDEEFIAKIKAGVEKGSLMIEAIIRQIEKE